MIQRIDLLAYPSAFINAVEYLNEKNLQTSQKQFNKCIQFNPSSYSSYLNLAYVYHIKKDFKKAIKLLDVAINIKPYSGEAYFNRCLALASLGRYSEAANDIRAAFSCLFYDAFFDERQQNGLGYLQKAVIYAENNVQALRLLVKLTNNQQKRSRYQKNLDKYQASYRTQGVVSQKKACAGTQHGLYRLNSSPCFSTLHSLKQQIELYTKYKQKLPQISFNSNQINLGSKNKSLKMQLGVLDIQIKSDYESYEQKVETQQQQQLQGENNFWQEEQSSYICKISEPKIKKSKTAGLPLRQIDTNFNININHANRNSLIQANNRNSLTLSIPDYEEDQKRYSFNGSRNQNHRTLKNSRLCLGGGGLAASRMRASKLGASRICGSSAGMNGSRVCKGGCTKCNRENQALPIIPIDSLKMQIKTIQIFRSENIYLPKPYLIIYDGNKKHVTQIDQQGGHFPIWNQTFYLHRNSEQPYRIQMWHKDYKERQDHLIGTTYFSPKLGRFKFYFTKKFGGARKTGYIFLQLGN